MAGRVVAAPSVAALQHHLSVMIGDDREELEEIVGGLISLKGDTAENGEPEVFTYGKLVNYLSSDEITHNQLIHAAAAALWKLAETDENDGRQQS